MASVSSEVRVRTSTDTPKAENKGLWIFFGLIALGLIVATLTGVTLSWDGSYVLFTLLDTQTPMVVHERWYVAPLQLPALFASKFISDTTILKILFGVMYAAIPFVALLLSWWVVRDKAPKLFVWAVFAIGLGTLPSQVSFINDANVAVQLTLPVVLAVLVGVSSRAQVVLGLGLATVLVFVHPVGAALFGLVGVIAVARGIWYKQEQRYMWVWAVFFATFTALTVWKFLATDSRYESEQLNFATLQRHFDQAVAGLPLIAVIISWLTAWLVFFIPFIKKSENRKMVEFVQFFALLLIGGGLTLWAINADGWGRAIDFRTWSIVSVFPYIVMATVESFRRKPEALGTNDSEWKHRANICRAIGLVFLIVLSIQSVVWLNLTGTIQKAATAKSPICISGFSIPNVANSAIGHWSITPYSLLLAGQQPKEIILNDYACTEKRLAEGVPVTLWEWRKWEGGWFDLSALKAQLPLAPQNSPTCRVKLISGWYPREEMNQNWWVWSGGQGKVEIRVEKDTNVVMRGALRAADKQNVVDIIVNGKKETSVNIIGNEINSFNSLLLKFKAGTNTVEFLSQNPPINLPNDPRQLAMVLSNLSFTENNDSLVCQAEN